MATRPATRAHARRPLPLAKAFTYIEPGPVVLLATHDRGRHNLMTLSWTMVLDFRPRFAIATGPWNHSFRALRKHRECVIAVPTADLLNTVVGIGTCSGADTDKFTRFGLTAVPAKMVGAPLVAECLANIECRVVEFIPRHDLVVLEAVAAHLSTGRKETRLLHAIGDGRFVADGRRYDRRRQMASKLPDGV